jgi:hypothetical protein
VVIINIAVEDCRTCSVTTATIKFDANVDFSRQERITTREGRKCWKWSKALSP